MILVVVDDLPPMKPTDVKILIVTWLTIVWLAEFTDKNIEIKVNIDNMTNLMTLSPYWLQEIQTYYCEFEYFIPCSP